jgi:hypothetical protein
VKNLKYKQQDNETQQKINNIKTITSLPRLLTLRAARPLLTNIVMARNTSGIQRFIDTNTDKITDTIAAKLAPIGFAHINMRGIMTFDLSTAKAALIAATDAIPNTISQES